MSKSGLVDPQNLLATLQSEYETWLTEITELDPFEDLKPARRLLGNLQRELLCVALCVHVAAPAVAEAAEKRAARARRLAVKAAKAPVDENELVDFCAGFWNAVDELVSGIAEAPGYASSKS